MISKNLYFFKNKSIFFYVSGLWQTIYECLSALCGKC